MATYSNLYIDQGTTFEANITVDIDLANFNVRGQFRKSHRSTIAHDFTCSIDGDQIKISLTAQETENLKPGRYVYDVEVYSDNIVHRVVEGQLEIIPEVTRESQG